MIAAELINEATQNGIHVAVVDGFLECTSDEPLPPAIISKLQSNKADIMRLLQAQRKIDNVNNTTWLDDNADELRESGFTQEDIHGSRYVTGVKNLILWGKQNLTVKLVGDVLCFSWQNAAEVEITQTCPPELKIPKRK